MLVPRRDADVSAMQNLLEELKELVVRAQETGDCDLLMEAELLLAAGRANADLEVAIQYVAKNDAAEGDPEAFEVLKPQGRA
jgi:hypothetical protein